MAPPAWSDSVEPGRGGAVEVCVGALMVRGGGPLRLLLTKRAAGRASYPGVWDVPGGHCEPGELPEDALVRELQEELGVTPTAWRPMGEWRAPVWGRPDEALILHLYRVTAWAGTPRNRQPAEHAAIAWFGLDEACGLDLAHPGYPALFRRLVTPPG